MRFWRWRAVEVPDRTAVIQAMTALKIEPALRVLYGKTGGKSLYERQRIKQKSRPVLKFGKR